MYRAEELLLKGTLKNKVGGIIKSEFGFPICLFEIISLRKNEK